MMYDSFEAEKILFVCEVFPRIETFAAVKAVKAEDYEMYLNVLAYIFSESGLYENTEDLVNDLPEIVEEAFYNETYYGWYEQHGFSWEFDQHKWRPKTYW